MCGCESDFFCFDVVWNIKETVSHFASVTHPELQTHFGPASESEGADKDADEVDEEDDGDFGSVARTTQEDQALTSGVSTLSSVISHEAQRPQHPLGAQLGRLKQETSRYTKIPYQHSV